MMELIETIEVGAGGATALDFQNIPQDGTHLQLIVSSRTNVGSTQSADFVSFNGVNISAVEGKILIGNGSATQSISWPYAFRLNGSTSTSNTFGNGSCYISNYAGSGKKSFLVESCMENAATASDNNIYTGQFPYTTAITSVQFGSVSGTFLQNTTASLYKIY